jgi:hypothetical protein
MLISSVVHAAPLGGQVTAGSAKISQSGATTTITQQTPNASLSWQSFNVSSNETKHKSSAIVPYHPSNPSNPREPVIRTTRNW